MSHLKENWLVTLLLAILLGLVGWVGAGQSEAIDRLQTGVNAALTATAALTERGIALMDRVNREADWDRAQITRIQEQISELQRRGL